MIMPNGDLESVTSGSILFNQMEIHHPEVMTQRCVEELNDSSVLQLSFILQILHVIYHENIQHNLHVCILFPKALVRCEV